MSLKECFEMEYRMSQACMHGTDFVEGIRALLVDKDHSPVWSTPSLSAVSDADVAAHFAPLAELEGFEGTELILPAVTVTDDESER